MWSWLLAVSGRSWAWLLSGHVGSPGGSAGKESACNAGDPGSIPVWGRSAGEGICYPLQYSWTSLGAQLVKNLPAMQETWLRFLGWEDLLEKGKATHSSILAWRNPWTVQSRGSQRVRYDWATFIFWASSLSWSSPALKILTGLLARNWHRCMNVCLCVCVCTCTNSESGKISHTEKLQQPLDSPPKPHFPSLPSYPRSSYFAFK